MNVEHSGHGVPHSAVSVVRVAPKRWLDHYAGAVLIVAGVIASVVLYSNHNDYWSLIALVVTIFAVVYGVTTVRTLATIGRPLATAGPDGISWSGFSIPWDRVVAVDFTTGKTRYLRRRPNKTKATEHVMYSLIVTTTEKDTSGRPLQFGTTFTGPFSGNFDEVKAAARRFSPAIEFRSTVSSSDLAVDEARTQQLLDQLRRDGHLDVLDKRGRRVLSVSPDAFSYGSTTIGWDDIDSVVAFTYVHTLRTSIGDSTSRDPRIALFQYHGQYPDGEYVPYRFGTFSVDYIDYPRTSSPTIEELAMVISRVAPMTRFTDRRTSA
ncbi:hypothetical protein [Tsukamurella sp. NPDC003166]|uniref:hypothetical protein n=1 Tax=Tsukamurella sp. NPDC003166 TaxID=3154444 RepID=UPI0033BD8E8E